MYCDEPKGQWDELARQVANVYRVQKHPILKGCINYGKAVLKKDCEQHAFRRQWHIYKDDDGSHQFSQRHLYGVRNLRWSWNDLWDRFWTSKKYGFSCSCSKNLGDLQSISTTCSWTFLKLCFHIRGTLLSNNIIFWECLACRQWGIWRQRETFGYFRIMKQLRQ